MGSAAVEADSVWWAGPNPGETVWRDDVLVVRRWVSEEVYLHAPDVHAVVLREMFEQINAELEREGAQPAQRAASVRWVEPRPWTWRPEARDWWEAEASMPCRLSHVVGSDSPALRIVHEGLRDVLGWLGWPALPDGRVPGRG